MPRHPDRSFIDQLLDGLSQIAQGMAETVADRIVNEFTPIVEPVAKPAKAKTGKRKRRRTESKPKGETHYSVLGVDPSAPVEIIAAAHRAQARLWHPDRLTGASPAKKSEAEAKIRRINQAAEILGNPETRKAYDRSLRG